MTDGANLDAWVLALACSGWMVTAGWWLVQWHWSDSARAPHDAHRIEPARHGRRARRKPAWVLRQLVLLQAHLPHAGCRLPSSTRLTNWPPGMTRRFCEPANGRKLTSCSLVQP